MKERLELKKKKPVYNPHEEHGGERGILEQYDEEIDGKKKKRFVLDGSGNSAEADAHRKEVAEKLKAKPITLDLPSEYLPSPYSAVFGSTANCDVLVEPEVASDYVDPSTLKIRKPKKKKKAKSTRKKSEDDDDILAPPADEDAPEADENSMEVDSKPAPKPKRTYEDVSFIDDEDLQSSLTIQRKLALKKRKILKPDDLARQLREESEVAGNGADTPMKEEDEEEPGLIIDETSEFVATLRAPTIPERKKSQSTLTVTAMAEDSSEPEDRDVDVNMEDEEEEEEEEEILHKSITPGPPEISSTGLDEEMTISRGVGATLAMLNQRGLLKRDEEADRKIQLLRDREKFRVEKRIRELETEEKAKQQRLRDRQSGKFDRMSAREREEHARWENKQRDLQEAREMQQRFKEYKPDVNLSYKDEFGRDMTQKEVALFFFLLYFVIS